MRKIGTLGRSHVFSASLSGALKSIYRAVKARKSAWRKLCRRQGTYAGLAFDGRYFWGFRQSRREEQSSGLLLYNQQGQVMRAFTTWPEASISYLSYCHNRLLVLDLEKQQLHQYCLADTLQPIASLDTIKSHPGYLPGGTAASGGIHDLCLLYVGAEAKNSVHLYNVDKLRPLVGYVDPQGVVQDHFMDGFLLLAQYSPLLNGRTFSDDLKGPPSQREDWLALFDQYFHPQGNLTALEACTAAMRAQMGASHAEVIKVVLGIPSADQRCQDWDQQGLSLAGAMQRVEVTRWAMQALIDRWSRAGFKGLTLSGFYYMSEQGAWNDPLLKIFPGLCHEQGLRSFAIPGLTSSWLTEYSRVGFDCVALQSSHAFWKPWRRPAHYALVSAGRIAREFGMGMEVELPYNILEPAGQEKLRDYLHMAYIQGWAGAFKTYFHSYNLIKALAESENPAGRELYDELYRLSRISRRPEVESGPANHGAIIIDWQHAWINNSGVVSFRLNIEGYQGVFELHGLSVR